MTKRQELMTITMEECGELIQACSKSIRCDDYENNDDLKEELGDVLCMIELIKENGLISQRELDNQVNIKRMKLMKWSKLFRYV
jgi:NTP pyrophosphatase (non-canonical NTP hydrolase)